MWPTFSRKKSPSDGITFVTIFPQIFVKKHLLWPIDRIWVGLPEMFWTPCAIIYIDSDDTTDDSTLKKL